MEDEDVTEGKLTLASLADYRPTDKQDEVTICCPYCLERKGTADTKYHLGLNLVKGLYHCYRCGKKGVFKDVAAFFTGGGMGSSLPDVESMRSRLAGTAKPRHGVDLEQISTRMHPSETPFAYDYVRRVRGFDDEDILRYRLRVGKEFWNAGKGWNTTIWCGRIVFPYYVDGRCVYAVGRTHVGKEPKYLNSQGPKAIVVYGLDEVTGDEAILCEGIISRHAAWKATGVPAVAGLGKDLTPFQLSRLRLKGVRRVFASLDADVSREDRDKVIKMLWAMGFDTWEVRLPLLVDERTGKKLKKDPDDWKDDYKRFFAEARRVSCV